jgi:tape measure domain-containing protein
VAIRGDASRLPSDIKSAQPGVEAAVGGIVASIGGIRSALLSLTGVGAAIGAVFKAGKFEQTTIAFETMIGSVEETKRTLASLTEFAAKTPFEMPEIEQAARGLIMFGERGQELMKTLNTLGNAASGTSTDFGMVALIFNQIRGVGKLLTQDFRQLSSRGIISLQDIAKYYGVTTKAAQEMLSTGKISFEDLKKILESLSQEGGRFANLMERQSKSLLGLWSTLKDAIGITARTIGQELLPTAKEFVGVAIKLTEGIRSFVQEHGTLVRNLIRAGEIWVTYKLAIIAAHRAHASYLAFAAASAGIKAFFTGAAATGAGTVAGNVAGGVLGGLAGGAAAGAASKIFSGGAKAAGAAVPQFATTALSTGVGGALTTGAEMAGAQKVADIAAKVWIGKRFGEYTTKWAAAQSRTALNAGMSASAFQQLGVGFSWATVGRTLAKLGVATLLAEIVGRMIAWGITSYWSSKQAEVEAENAKPSDTAAYRSIEQMRKKEIADAAANAPGSAVQAPEVFTKEQLEFYEATNKLDESLKQVLGGYTDAEMAANKFGNTVGITRGQADAYLATAKRIERANAFRKVQDEIKELTKNVAAGSLGLTDMQAHLRELSQTEGVTESQIRMVKFLSEVKAGNTALADAKKQLKDLRKEIFFLANGYTEAEKAKYNFDESLGQDIRGDRQGNARRARASQQFGAGQDLKAILDDQKKIWDDMVSKAKNIMTPSEKAKKDADEIANMFLNRLITKEQTKQELERIKKEFGKKDWAFEGSVGVSDLGRRIQDALLKPTDKGLTEQIKMNAVLNKIDTGIGNVEKAVVNAGGFLK